MNGTLTSAWICRGFSKWHTCGAMLQLMPWAFRLITWDLCLLFWPERLPSSYIQSWWDIFVSRNTEVSWKILMIKKLAHLLTVVFLVLGINKYVSGHLLNRLVLNQHIRGQNFCKSSKLWWSPWNNANHFQLRPWPKHCEKPQMHAINILLSMKQKTQMLYYDGNGFIKYVAINGP